MSFEEPTEEEDNARHQAMAGGCDLIAPGGHCHDIDSVVLWHGHYIGLNDRYRSGDNWSLLGVAELRLSFADEERIWKLLVEAGRKLLEIQAIGESWRERLVEESRRPITQRDSYRYVEKS